MRELSLFSLEKKQVRDKPINVYQKGGCQENGSRLFPAVPSNRTRDNGQKLRHRKLYLNMRKELLYCAVTTHWNGLPREAAESPSLEIFKTSVDTILYNLL